MDQVAARAKVSQATVSHVLGGKGDRLKISPQTQKRVLDVAQELGYHRNLLVRAMVTGKSRIIGVLTSFDANENIVKILAGAMEAANAHDYLLKVMHMPYNKSDNTTVTRCLEWRLAGAMIVGLMDDPQRQLQAQFQQAQLPLALIDNSPLPEWGVRFVSDDLDGIAQVTQHLIGLGHRRIALLGGAPSELSNWRASSFRATLTEAGLTLPSHWVRHTSWRDDEIITEGVNALLREDRPTAIVCSSDVIAMVLIREARAIGLRLPADLSITGYSSTSLSAYTDPALTTVYQPFQAMGRAAAMHLIQCAETDELNPAAGPRREVLLPTQLIIRRSTASLQSE